jgi:hypothetical protein
MPIFKFLAVTGSILLALLFVANATLTPHGPLFTNNSEGLPRSQPIRAQEAELPPEPPRPRAPALVQVAPPQAVAPPVAAAPPLAEVPAAPAAETAVSAPAAPEAITASAPAAPKAAAVAAPAAPEPIAASAPQAVTASAPVAPKAATASAPAAPKAVAGPVAPEAVTASAPAAVTAAATVKTAAAPTKRKQAARKPERIGQYAAYRDGSNARDHRGPVENGYPYGVSPGEARAERRDWQRQWSGGDFGQNRGRF